GSKLQTDSQLTILDGAQVIVGGVVSATVTVWLHVLLWPQLFVASQVRVMICGHVPLVTVPVTVIVTFESLQLSVAVGGSKSHTVPQATVLLVAQLKVSTSRPLVPSVKPCSP